MSKSISLGELFTEAQIEQARSLYQTAAPGTFAKLCAEQVVQPNIEAIQQKAGQDMDAKYLAYQLEYAFMQMENQ